MQTMYKLTDVPLLICGSIKIGCPKYLMFILSFQRFWIAGRIFKSRETSGIWTARSVPAFVMHNSLKWHKAFKAFNSIKIIENRTYVLSEYVFISTNVKVFDKHRFYSICLWYILFSLLWLLFLSICNMFEYLIFDFFVWILFIIHYYYTSSSYVKSCPNDNVW